MPSEIPNYRNRPHLLKPYFRKPTTPSKFGLGNLFFGTPPLSAPPFSDPSARSFAYQQSTPMQQYSQTESLGNSMAERVGNVGPPPFSEGSSSYQNSNGFDPYAASSSTLTPLAQPAVLKNVFSWLMGSGSGNSTSNAEGGPSRHQTPQQFKDYAAPIGSAFAGQMASAGPGPSRSQDPLQLISFGGPLIKAEPGASHGGEPLDMDFGGRMPNVGAGPSYDQDTPFLTDLAGQMTNTETGPPNYQNYQNALQVMDYGGMATNAEAGPSYNQNPVRFEVGQLLQPLTGDECAEEDETYFDFRDGFDNPAAVRNVATMVDEMTGLDVAKKLAGIGRYDSISDLASGLDDGHAEEYKAEDLEKTRCALKVLTPKLLPTPENPDPVFVKAVSFSKVTVGISRRMGLDFSSPPMSLAKSTLLLCLLPLFTSQVLQATLLSEFDKLSIASDLAVSIALISSSANDVPEAFSRKIIDQFSLSMHKLLQNLNMAVYEVVEFRIATLENPVEILKGNFKTILTGFTDYAYFLKSDWEMPKIKEFCDFNQLRGVKKLLNKIQVNNVQIFMIEAKSKAYSSVLTTCIPQMGAECIAVMKSSNLSSMAWCLSTGSTWIFGIIVEDNGKYAMHMLQPMQLQLQDAAKDGNVAIVHDILWAMICWTSAPVNTIINKIFPMAKPKSKM